MSGAADARKTEGPLGVSNLTGQSGRSKGQLSTQCFYADGGGNLTRVQEKKAATKTPAAPCWQEFHNSRYPDQGHGATGSRNPTPARVGEQEKHPANVGGRWPNQFADRRPDAEEMFRELKSPM